MNWLQKKLFNKKISQQLLHKQRGDEPAKNEVQDIAILLETSDESQYEVVKSSIKNIKKRGKTIHLYQYRDLKSLSEELDSEQLFCKQDFNWYHIATSPKAIQFVQQNFDMLICINPQRKPCLNYLNVSSNAKFKIGVLPDHIEHYNLMMDTKDTSNISQLFKEIESILDKLSN